MYKISIIVLVSVLLFHCTQHLEQSNERNQIEYLLIYRTANKLDTVYRNLSEVEYGDSIYRYTYLEKWENEEYEKLIEFPISTSAKTLKLQSTKEDFRLNLIDKKEIKYGDDKFPIYKYYYDEPNSDDEEELFFFSPKLGLLIEKYAWWGNYYRLVDNGNLEQRDDIFYICERIINDEGFFNRRN